jgi:hypothetical protein
VHPNNEALCDALPCSKRQNASNRGLCSGQAPAAALFTSCQTPTVGPSRATVLYFFTSVERPRKASDEIYWIPKRLTGEHKQGSTRLVVEVYSLLSMAVISVHLPRLEPPSGPATICLTRAIMVPPPATATVVVTADNFTRSSIYSLAPIWPSGHCRTAHSGPT